MGRKFLNSKGFSLVEVVIATLIVVLVLLAFYGVYINAKNTLLLAAHKVTALYWAQDEIERLRNQVRGSPDGSDTYQDEQSEWPFGDNTGGGGYPTSALPAEGWSGSPRQHRNLVDDGVSISYITMFRPTPTGATVQYNPPGYIPLYATAQTYHNYLIDELNGIIWQHVDYNSTDLGAASTAWRQVTVKVRWDEDW